MSKVSSSKKIIPVEKCDTDDNYRDSYGKDSNFVLSTNDRMIY